jgi:hypothetical protein
MTCDYVRKNQASQSLPNTVVTELMAATLDKNAYFRFTAPGFSMAPFIRNGDMITIAPKQLRYGDVVAFVKPCCGKLTVHRIIRISGAEYLIKGDNLAEADGLVPASSIIGRVVRVEHLGRQMRLGLGIERIAIAWLSCRGWLMPLVGTVWRFLKPIVKR